MGQPVPESGTHWLIGEGGHRFQADAPYPEPLAQRIAKGDIKVEGPVDAETPADSPQLVRKPVDVERDEAGEPKRPAVNDSKEAWAAYAVARGADPGEIELCSKKQLTSDDYHLPPPGESDDA